MSLIIESLGHCLRPGFAHSRKRRSLSSQKKADVEKTKKIPSSPGGRRRRGGGFLAIAYSSQGHEKSTRRENV
jgi:hypothetical protein